MTNGGRRGLRLHARRRRLDRLLLVAYAKTSAQGAKLEDYKGKNLCLVDPNSTSGNNVPLYSMSKMGIEPEKFFGKVTNAGSHENAVMAVQQGTCDVAFNCGTPRYDSNLTRMANKGMVKKDGLQDRVPLREDSRIGPTPIWPICRTT